MLGSQEQGKGSLGNGRQRVRVFALTSCLVAVSVLASSTAVSSGYSDEKVKAAYLLNFTRFVDWPESSFGGETAPFVICVLNDSEFTATASEIIGERRIDNRTISVEERIDVDGADTCHIFFVPKDQAEQHAAVIDQTSGHSVFTISASAGFAEMGGVANFVRSHDRIRLEINRKAVMDANLEVSARLLRIADVVG